MDSARREVHEAAGAAFALPVSDGQLAAADGSEEQGDAAVRDELDQLWDRLIVDELVSEYRANLHDRLGP